MLSFKKLMGTGINIITNLASYSVVTSNEMKETATFWRLRGASGVLTWRWVAGGGD